VEVAKAKLLKGTQFEHIPSATAQESVIRLRLFRTFAWHYWRQNER